MAMSFDVPIQEFKLSRCYKEIEAIIDDYRGDDGDAKLVQTKDQILESCFRHGYAYDQKLNVKEVGAMPTNRDREGISYLRAHSRVSVIKSSGFSKAALQNNAIGAEDHPAKREYAKYTAKLNSINPGFAKYKEFQIKIGTLGASHATHGCACIMDEVPCSIENISVNGFMNKEKCWAKDPAFRAACIDGIDYKVIKWVVMESFPIIAKIIQRALNTVMQVGEGESWLQNLLNIVDEASTFTTNVDWAKVTNTVLQSSPPRMEDIPDMVAYIRKWGGMPSGMFVKELADLCKIYMPTNRVVSGAFFKTLADLKFDLDTTRTCHK